jgi:hypothetical protein
VHESERGEVSTQLEMIRQTEERALSEGRGRQDMRHQENEVASRAEMHN